MGELAPMTLQHSGKQFTEAELREIACERYCQRPLTVRNLLTIARHVGMPKESIERWRDEDNWILRRSQFQAQKAAGEVSKIEQLLKEAGLKNSSESAVEVLKVCEQALNLTNKEIATKAKKEGVDPAAVEKLVNVIDRIMKIQKEAYSRL